MNKYFSIKSPADCDFSNFRTLFNQRRASIFTATCKAAQDSLVTFIGQVQNGIFIVFGEMLTPLGDDISYAQGSHVLHMHSANQFSWRIQVNDIIFHWVPSGLTITKIRQLGLKVSDLSILEVAALPFHTKYTVSHFCLYCTDLADLFWASLKMILLYYHLTDKKENWGRTKDQARKIQQMRKANKLPENGKHVAQFWTR